MTEIRPIDDRERVALYGTCTTCSAPRDVYEISRGDGAQEMCLVCTATTHPSRDDWGHPQ